MKASNSEISEYRNIRHTDNGTITNVQEFLDKVKYGHWKSIATNIAIIEDPDERAELKKETLPYVTISGRFGRRTKEDLIKHSGFICIDFDKLEDIDCTIEKLKNDPYTFAMFKSVSGRGLAVLVKIDGRRHLDAYLGLETYYANKLGEITDRSCKDTSRARFVSYDPNLFQNENSIKFEAYLPKKETQRKLPNVITGKGDIEFILEQIKSSSIDLTQGSYFRYRDIGFSIASEYGESGRDYFHFIASFNHKYDQSICDKQYNNCLRSKGEGITIATLLYYAKEAGLQIMSPKTKEINTVAMMGKNSGRSIEDTIEILSEVHGISEEDSRELTEKVYASDKIGSESKLSTLEALRMFISDNYSIKRNEINRFIQVNGVDVDTTFMNSIYFRARAAVDDKIRFEEIDRLVNSDFIQNYNPLKEFLASAEEDTRTTENILSSGFIKQLADSLDIDTGEQNAFSASYKYHFLTKWMVGLIASIHGNHSVLTLVLTGGIGTGKTEFFRRLLPEQLKDYYAESKLDSGKDDEILMTQKLIIMDDEFGGKNKLESKRFKELTSKDFFTLREPYGRRNVTLKRFAVLCGTSNVRMILSDPSGNRRIIPMEVISIDHDKYNSVDKTKLLHEASELYNRGYNFRLTREDIKCLNDQTGQFDQIRTEKELIEYFCQVPKSNIAPGVEFLPATILASRIEKVTGTRMSIAKIGEELQAAGFKRVRQRSGGKQVWGYNLIWCGTDNGSNYNETNNEAECPF